MPELPEVFMMAIDSCLLNILRVKACLFSIFKYPDTSRILPLLH